MLRWNGEEFDAIWSDGVVRLRRIGCNCDYDLDDDDFGWCADCNPSDPTVHPGAPETCDGNDNNCNGLIDEGLPSYTYYRDTDGDRYGTNSFTTTDCSTTPPPGYAAAGSDCDDTNPAIHPGAPELCNGIDDDCNGLVDDYQGVLDVDGDGVPGVCDDCPTRFNPDQRDDDRDGIGNACDNCLFLANTDQADADSDGVGNACDNCPLSYNPTQLDTDHDGWGDVCDNCPTTKNESQHDINRNGVGDECDLNDGLVIFKKVGRTNVTWQNDPAYTTYNLYRGSLAVLLAGGPYSQVDGSNPYAHHYCGLATTSQADTLAPALGEALYYLVTGKGASGEEPLGHGDVNRPNVNPCP